MSVDRAEAEDFLRLMHAEQQESGDLKARLEQVRQEIDETGTYVHTAAELTFGARIAWRNSHRCIGRLYWKSLLVRDLRSVNTPASVFVELVRHLEIAVGDHDDPAAKRSRTKASAATAAPQSRRLRPVISIFAPVPPGAEPAVRVWNDQLIRYAGYRATDGSTIGDPQYVQFTEAVRRLGWQGAGGRFDVLPLVIEGPDRQPRTFELPEHAVIEVPITHPEYPWFAELGLRWHAVPAISNMRLSIGGVDYPLAPFNGWYLGTEIGARNLADSDRYDQLPVVAARLGLDMQSNRTLWRDSALVELNRAVLYSFEQAGMRISDHHTESQRFIDHIAREERAGRTTPADWTWVVPPMSAALSPLYHRYYDEVELKPNFYLDAAARELSRCGGTVPNTPVAAAARTDPAATATAAHGDVDADSGANPLPRPRVRPAVPQSAPTRQPPKQEPMESSGGWRWPFRQRPAAQQESTDRQGSAPPQPAVPEPTP